MSGTESDTFIDPTERIDQRVFFHGVTWKQYEAILAMRGESGGTRLAYLEGELEIMTPSFDHEAVKTAIARMLEAWADETGVDLLGAGSWTIRKAAKRRGVEPDECYIVGTKRKRAPDLAIEVVWTSGGLDKLDIYRGLEVGEVWVWQHGAIEAHVLGRKGYERRRRSGLFPDLDLQLIGRFATERNQPQAVRDFRALFRRS